MKHEATREILEILGESHSVDHLAFDAAGMQNPQKFPFEFSTIFELGERLCAEQSLRYAPGVNRTARFAVLESETGTAYAVWIPESTADWVLVSTKLLEKLFINTLAVALHLTSDIAFRLKEEAELLTAIRSAAQSESLKPDGLHMLLFSASLAQIIGHELGHHAYGHEWYYRDLGSRVGPDESEEWGDVFSDDTASLEKQALELAADHSGVEVTVRLLAERAENKDADLVIPGERLMCMAAMAIVCAYVSLGARSWQRKDIPAAGHPIAAIRCYSMLALLHHLVPQVTGEKVGNLRNGWWAGVMFAADSLGSLLLMPTREEASGASETDFYTRLHDSLEAVGLKRTFFDNDTLRPYVQLLHDTWGHLRERCRTSWRIPDPLPLMRE